MLTALERQRVRIGRFLRGRVSPDIIERGIEIASYGRVIECSRVGELVQGIIAEATPDGREHALHVQLDLGARTALTARCSCSSDADAGGAWCEHAVALLWRAADLGFIDHEAGSGVPLAGTARPRTPEELAAVLRSLRSEPDLALREAPAPDVSVVLDFSRDRLGVRVHFDGETQGPSLFQHRSSRELDNVMLRLLEESADWDEESGTWYVSSSTEIEPLLGLAREFRSVSDASTGGSLRLSRELLRARVVLTWTESGAELRFVWRLPDGTEREKQREIVGTGPFWTVVDGTVYLLGTVAARLAVFFPHGPATFVPRERVGPLLAAVRDDAVDTGTLVISNAAQQPESRTVDPAPVLELRRADESADLESGPLELRATLEFEYPVPDPGVVYLPHLEKEAEHTAQLTAAGFEPLRERGEFRIRGDAALDFVSAQGKMLPGKWKVAGLAEAGRGIRFSELVLVVSLNEVSDPDGPSSRAASGSFDCHVSLLQNNAQVPLSSIFRSASGELERWVRLDSGAFARIPGGGLGSLRTTLGLLDTNFRLSNTIRARLSAAQAVSFGRLREQDISLLVDTRLKELLRKFQDFSAIKPLRVSRKFAGTLRPYQEEGLSWLAFLNEFGFGGILADEMGLGKTVQALALIQKLRERPKPAGSIRRPALVVAPTSVVTNWQYEAARFTPNLKTLVLHGPTRRRHFSELGEHDLVITSYALLRIDRYDLERQQFSYLILDEAQNIKNPDAAVTKAAKALRSDHRLALTGTPTENRPMELWSIMDFLMPGYLGSSEFFRRFIEQPILDSGPGADVARGLNAKTRPFILRRAKADVERDLPPKTEAELHVDMTPSQRALYEEILAEVRPKVFAAVEKSGLRGASISILAALLRLRQVCNHPRSLEAFRDAQEYDSGKFGLLQELVTEALDSGRKLLIFAQFREMLAIIRRWFEAIGTSYLYLDGETRNRQALVDRFNTDESVRAFLISLKAGGTGINLTAADTVVLYDPWWNPAVENQAIDRAHRIGQTKAVNVYRLVTEHSVEQRIMELKSKKSRIVESLIHENALSPRALSKKDLEMLFAPLPVEG